jgi:hypothetical protein
MDKPIVVPNLEAGTDARRVEPASGYDRAIVVVALKIVGPAAVIAVIHDLDAVEGHRGLSLNTKTKERPRPLFAVAIYYRGLGREADGR